MPGLRRHCGSGSPPRLCVPSSRPSPSIDCEDAGVVGGFILASPGMASPAPSVGSPRSPSASYSQRDYHLDGGGACPAFSLLSYWSSKTSRVPRSAPHLRSLPTARRKLAPLDVAPMLRRRGVFRRFLRSRRILFDPASAEAVIEFLHELFSEGLALRNIDLLVHLIDSVRGRLPRRLPSRRRGSFLVSRLFVSINDRFIRFVLSTLSKTDRQNLLGPRSSSTCSSTTIDRAIRCLPLKTFFGLAR